MSEHEYSDWVESMELWTDLNDTLEIVEDEDDAEA
jgi:hypothetical protein